MRVGHGIRMHRNQARAVVIQIDHRIIQITHSLRAQPNGIGATLNHSMRNPAEGLGDCLTGRDDLRTRAKPVMMSMANPVHGGARHPMPLLVAGHQQVPLGDVADVGLPQPRSDGLYLHAIARNAKDFSIVDPLIGQLLATFGQIEASIVGQYHGHGKLTGLGRLSESITKILLFLVVAVSITILQADDAIARVDVRFPLFETDTHGFMQPCSHSTPLHPAGGLIHGLSQPEIAIKGRYPHPSSVIKGHGRRSHLALPGIGVGQWQFFLNHTCLF